MNFLKMHYQRFQVLIYREGKPTKQIEVPARNRQDAIELAKSCWHEPYTRIACDGYGSEY